MPISKKKKSPPVSRTKLEAIEETADKSMSTTTDATLKVNTGVLRRAQKHAKDLGITQKKYVEEALRYFFKYGLDPCQEVNVEQLSKEMVRLRNQVFSFLQKQEQIYLLPIAQILTRLEQNKDEAEGIGEPLEKIYEVLNRIRILEQTNLATQYQLSDADEETIKKVRQKNEAFMKEEISKFSSNEGK